jgi:OOP family OmpA-OmpF porin
VQQAPEPKPEPAPIAAQPAPAPQPAPIVAAPPPPRMLIQKVTLSTDLLFAFDKAQLREEGKEKLDELAAQAKDARVEEVLAIGYADPIGRPAYNEKLSAERAAAVKDYLVQQGVPSERINVEGRGESRQFTDGRCDKLSGRKLIDCFEPNRRVEVELLGSRQVAAGEAPEAAGAAGTTGSPSAPAGAAGSAR